MNLSKLEVRQTSWIVSTKAPLKELFGVEARWTRHAYGRTHDGFGIDRRTAQQHSVELKNSMIASAGQYYHYAGSVHCWSLDAAISLLYSKDDHRREVFHKIATTIKLRKEIMGRVPYNLNVIDLTDDEDFLCMVNDVMTYADLRSILEEVNL